MGWVDKPHSCSLPLVTQYKPKVGAWFECGWCRRTWRVQAVVPRPPDNYGLTFIYGFGDTIITRSWQEVNYENLSQD